MTILLVLIPLGLISLAVAVAAFIWAARSGQFDDLEGEGARILFDDEDFEPQEQPTRRTENERDAP